MKTALITGSSRGIGRAVARELAHQGWSVGINYLTREDKARELVEELRADGCSAAAFQADEPPWRRWCESWGRPSARWSWW